MPYFKKIYKTRFGLHLLLLIILSFFYALTVAQDLSGVWQGKFYNSKLEGTLDDSYKYEVQLVHDQDDATIKGVTYSYQTTVFYGKAEIIGSYKASSSVVVIREIKMLEIKTMSGSDGCLMTCTMHYSKKGDDAYLKGTYTSVNMNTGLPCGGGEVFLHKTDKSDFYKEKMLLNHKPRVPNSSIEDKKAGIPTPVVKPPITTKKPVMDTFVAGRKNEIKKPANSRKPIQDTLTMVRRIDKPTINRVLVDTTKQQRLVIKPITVRVVKEVPIQNQPSVLKERNNVLAKIIYTSTDSITIDLYDNGEIDKDTVTVFHNNQLLVNAQQLNVKPIEVKIGISEKDPHHEIILVANNLGEIPPNTALMVVRAGNKRYEVRIVSTEQKNAKIIFEYKKE